MTDRRSEPANTQRDNGAVEEREEFDRFEELAKKLVTVRKREVDELRKQGAKRHPSR